MLLAGKKIKLNSGAHVRIESLIKAGGQGEAYWASGPRSGGRGVVKIFHPRFATPETAQRMLFLVAQRLHPLCPVLCAPVEVVQDGAWVGHYTPIAEGIALEEYLASPTATFLEAIQLALALAHAVDILHQRGLAHGDLHAENLIVQRAGSVFKLSLIDFDNFAAPNLPPPPCVGHNLYMAPELRSALANGTPAFPTIEADRFALGVLMHEIILLVHVSAGNDQNEADFQKAMCSGRWLHDPSAPDRPKGNLGGFPVEVLSANIARLIRLALDRNPAQRPTAAAWKTELDRALNSVFSCPQCSGPCLIDVAKVSCPLCGHPFGHLVVQDTGGRTLLSLIDGATAIGRNQLGGSPKVSLRHAVFRRVGPETWLETTGSNGSARWSNGTWVKLPDKKSVLVQKGDRLKFADVVVQLG